MDTATNLFIYIFGIVLVLAIIIFAVVAMWRFYEKAGRPGWAAFIPIYNVIVLNEIAGRPTWWIVLYLIPFVNIIVSLIVSIDTAKAFGRSTAFGVVGLFLFSTIGYAIIAFGNDTYTQPVHA